MLKFTWPMYSCPEGIVLVGVSSRVGPRRRILQCNTMSGGKCAPEGPRVSGAGSPEALKDSTKIFSFLQSFLATETENTGPRWVPRQGGSERSAPNAVGNQGGKEPQVLLR